MPNLYNISTKNELSKNELTDREKLSLLYHNLFDFPLSISDLIKWLPSEKAALDVKRHRIVFKNGYYYFEGREGLVYKRLLRKRISVKKKEIAKKAANVLSVIPGVKMVGITGSLAMENSSEDSDIDLIIVTKNNQLWTTRLTTYLILYIFHYVLRKPNDRNQKDKLCLNMWIDEGDLIWNKNNRNLYTAHEIAQVVPLVDKDKTYEKFIRENKWILKYWPNAVKIGNTQQVDSSMLRRKHFLLSIVEKFAYRLQYQHMKSKITKEVVTPTRAFFHPQDWGKFIISKIGNHTP